MVLVACFSHSEEKFLIRTDIWSFCMFVVVVCLLDLRLILLRTMVQHCGQSEYDYGQLHEALESGTF